MERSVKLGLNSVIYIDEGNFLSINLQVLVFVQVDGLLLNSCNSEI